MTRPQAATLAPILAAYGRGEVVQWGSLHREIWQDYDPEKGHPEFGASSYGWRIKPAPREWWVCPNLKCRVWYLVTLNDDPCKRCATPLVKVREVVE